MVQQVQTFSGDASAKDQSYDAPPPHCNELTLADDARLGFRIHNVSEDNNALCAEWQSPVSISHYRRWTQTEDPMFQVRRGVR